MGKLDTSYKAKMQQVDELRAESERLRQELAKAWASESERNKALRAEVERLRKIEAKAVAWAEETKDEELCPCITCAAIADLRAAVRGDPGASGSGEGASGEG